MRVIEAQHTRPPTANQPIGKAPDWELVVHAQDTLVVVITESDEVAQARGSVTKCSDSEACAFVYIDQLLIHCIIQTLDQTVLLARCQHGYY